MSTQDTDNLLDFIQEQSKVIKGLREELADEKQRSKSNNQNKLIEELKNELTAEKQRIASLQNQLNLLGDNDKCS